MKIYAIGDIKGNLPIINTPCDIIFIVGGILSSELNSDILRAEMWTMKYLSNWVQNLPCTHCIAVLSNSDTVYKTHTDILERLCKFTKYKIEFLQNKESSIILDDEVFKIYCIEDKPQVKYNIPKFCDIVVTSTEDKILHQEIKNKCPMYVVCNNKVPEKRKMKSKFINVNTYFDI